MKKAIFILSKLANGASTKHLCQSDLSPVGLPSLYHFPLLCSDEFISREFANGASTKHPSESDWSLRWCNYNAPRAIRFVSPMVHLHMHLFARAKKTLFPTAAPGSISSHQGNTAPISSLQRNTQPRDVKGGQKGVSRR